MLVDLVMFSFFMRINNDTDKKAKRGSTPQRKNAQQTFFPYAGIFEEIKAVDYPYRFTKTQPKMIHHKCRQNRSHGQHIYRHKD